MHKYILMELLDDEGNIVDVCFRLTTQEIFELLPMIQAIKSYHGTHNYEDAYDKYVLIGDVSDQDFQTFDACIPFTAAEFIHVISIKILEVSNERDLI